MAALRRAMSRIQLVSRLLNYCSRYRHTVTGTLIFCTLSAFSSVAQKHCYQASALSAYAGDVSTSAFRAFILIETIKILVNTMNERKYTFSHEEHTSLQLLAQHLTVSLLTA